MLLIDPHEALPVVGVHRADLRAGVDRHAREVPSGEPRRAGRDPVEVHRAHDEVWRAPDERPDRPCFPPKRDALDERRANVGGRSNFSRSITSSIGLGCTTLNSSFCPGFGSARKVSKESLVAIAAFGQKTCPCEGNSSRASISRHSSF